MSRVLTIPVVDSDLRFASGAVLQRTWSLFQ
jgi:hypothetical protein